MSHKNLQYLLINVITYFLYHSFNLKFIIVDKLVKKYYEEERDKLLKSAVNIQRLIKCIINDTEDDVERGEMIGFVHAIRSIRDCEKPKPNAQKILKPYKR